MRILLMTIIIVVAMALALIFVSEAKGNPYNKTPDAQEPSSEMFARLFQKSLPCSNSEFAHKDLTNRLQLRKVWWGLTTEKELATLYINQHKGNWVLLLSSPNSKLRGQDASLSC